MNLDDPSGDTWEEIWDRVIDTNLKGTFFCSVEAARLMRAGGRRLDRQRVVGRRGPGPAQPRRLRSEQGRNQRAHDPAGRGARARPDPGQRLRARSDERAAQPRRRPVVPRDVGSVDPARPDRRAGGHGRPDGVPRLRGVLTRHRASCSTSTAAGPRWARFPRDTSTSRNASSNASIDFATPAAAEPGLRAAADRAAALDPRLAGDGDRVPAARARGHALAGTGRVRRLRRAPPVRRLRPARRRGGRPLEPQAADDRGRRGPCGRDCHPRRDDPPRPGVVLADRGRRVHRGHGIPLLQHRSRRRAPRHRSPAAAARSRGGHPGERGGGDARRAAARRRALHTRPCRPVPLRRRLLRVLVPLARADADAVPGGT